MLSEKEIDKIAKEMRLALNKLQRYKLKRSENCSIKMNKAQLFVLMLIKNLGENVTTKDISTHMCTTMGAVTHHIKELEKLNFIEKITSDTDGRVFYIELSRKGNKYLKEVEKEQYKQMTKLIQYIGLSDSKKMIEIINKLVGLSLKD